MRLPAFALFVLPAAQLFAPALSAQTAPAPPLAAGQIHCSVQPAPTASDALAAFVAGDNAKAESLYSAQVSSSPGPAYAGVVRTELQANQLKKAQDSAHAAVAALPGSALAQSLEGDAYLRAGQLAPAADAYKKALALDPCSARARFGVARIYTFTGQPAFADREYNRARALSPDPEILAAYLLTLPADKRAAPLHAFLATKPQLAPDQLVSLTTQLALLDQHALCTPEESVARIKLGLDPIMFNGAYTRSWGLKTRLNNGDTPLLELDTSVSGIVLNQHDAARAGVHPLGEASATQPYTAVVDHVQIGPLKYSNCPVRVLPDLALGKANSLIGLDFFRDHLIRLDYADQSMTLGPFPAEPGTPIDIGSLPVTPTTKAWQPIIIADGNVLVPTMINKDGPYLFALDTGINRTVLSPAVATAALGSMNDNTINLQGVSSAIVKVVPKTGGGNVDYTEVYSGDGKSLDVRSPSKFPVYQFAGNLYSDPRTIVFDLSAKSHVAGLEISGLLSFRVLSGFLMEINYRDSQGRILLDQNRRYAVNEASKHVNSVVN